MENILFYIQQYASSMTESEKRIATAIMENPRESINAKICDLARIAKVSPSAVTRFCRRLGLSGYTEFKMQLAKDVYLSRNQGLNVNLQFNPDIDLQTASEISVVIKNVMSTVGRSFDLLDRLTNPRQIEQAVHMIRGAKRILIIGIGASGLVGLDLYQKLLRLGLPATYNVETHLQMVCACTLSKDDLAYIISYSGETPEIITIAREAKNLGASIIGVTRVGNTSLLKLADLALYVPDTENICRNGAFISRLNQLVINDMIFYSLLSQYYDEYQAPIDRTWQGVSAIAPKLAKSHGDAGEPKGGAPLEL